MKRRISRLLMTLLLSTMFTAMHPIKVLAQQEITPEWAIDNGTEFTRLTVSADGKYIIAATNNTNRLYVFHGNESIWNSPVDSVHSLAMSADGRYIAVGTENYFYFFNLQNSTPQLKYPLDYEKSLVAISADGNTTVVGTTPRIFISNTKSKLYLFEKEKSIPTWNNTILGILESLSVSDDGSYIAVSTSMPGTLYLFTKEHAAPFWFFRFGEKSGGAKISNNGDYIVAVGGNQTSNRAMRIYRFRRQASSPNYIKVISELPSSSGLTISADGSIFATSYKESNYLIMFNLELPPYGYGPGSVLNASLTSSRVSMSMSLDGRYITVGTVEGIFIYEYLDRQLTLKKQYTSNKPFINDIALSTNGRYIIAAATIQMRNDKRSIIYFFDNFQETQNSTNPWLQFVPIILAMAIITFTAIYFIRQKKQSPKNSHNHWNVVKLFIEVRRIFS